MCLQTHINVRGSFRILNFTPWSAKDLDKNVDSAIPGKLLGGDTKKESQHALGRRERRRKKETLTSKAIGNDRLQVMHRVPREVSQYRQSCSICSGARHPEFLPSHLKECKLQSKLALNFHRQIPKNEETPIYSPRRSAFHHFRFSLGEWSECPAFRLTGIVHILQPMQRRNQGARQSRGRGHRNWSIFRAIVQTAAHKIVGTLQIVPTKTTLVSGPQSRSRSFNAGANLLR